MCNALCRYSSVPLFVSHAPQDGTLKKVCRKQDKERWFVLFTDILIYAAFDPTKLSLKHEMFRLEKTVVAPAEEPPHAFSIISEQKSFVVYGKDEDEKVDWVCSIQKQVESIGNVQVTLLSPCSLFFILSSLSSRAQVAHAPVWTPDKQSACCTRCEVEFTLINRRHHCRKCGVLVSASFFFALSHALQVCGKCSSHKMIVPNIDRSKSVRVCDGCLMGITEHPKDLGLTRSSNPASRNSNLGGRTSNVASRSSNFK